MPPFMTTNPWLNVAIIVVTVLLIAGLILGCWALGEWIGVFRLRRRKAAREPQPPMAASDVDIEHDWDGWLISLTTPDPTPTLREEQIEVPREGEAK